MSETDLITLIVIDVVANTIPGILQLVVAPLFTGTLVSKMQMRKTAVAAGLAAVGLTTIVIKLGYLLELESADFEVVVAVMAGLTSVVVGVTAGGLSGVMLGFLIGSKVDFFVDDTNPLTLLKDKAVGTACDSISVAEIAAELVVLETHSVAKHIFTAIPGIVGVVAIATGLLNTFNYTRATVVICAEIFILVLWGYKTGDFPGVTTASCLFGLSVGVEWVKSETHSSILLHFVMRMTSSNTTGSVTLVSMLQPAVGDTLVLLMMGLMLVVHQWNSDQETQVLNITVTRCEKPVAPLRQLAAG